MRRRSIMMSSSLRTLEGDGATGSSSRISSIVARRRRWRISMIWLSRRVSALGVAGMAALQKVRRIFSPVANIFASTGVCQVDGTQGSNCRTGDRRLETVDLLQLREAHIDDARGARGVS